MLRGDLVEDFGGQASGLRPEQEGILGAEARFDMVSRCVPGKRKDVTSRARIEVRLQVRVLMDAREFGIVEPGPAQVAVRELEAERADKVQLGPGVSAEADDIAGVGRNLRPKKNDIR